MLGNYFKIILKFHKLQKIHFVLEEKLLLLNIFFFNFLMNAEVPASSNARKNANVKQWKSEIDANFHREMQLGTRVFDWFIAKRVACGAFAKHSLNFSGKFWISSRF